MQPVARGQAQARLRDTGAGPRRQGGARRGPGAPRGAGGACEGRRSVRRGESSACCFRVCCRPHAVSLVPLVSLRCSHSCCLPQAVPSPPSDLEFVCVWDVCVCGKVWERKNPHNIPGKHSRRAHRVQVATVRARGLRTAQDGGSQGQHVSSSPRTGGGPAQRMGAGVGRGLWRAHSRCGSGPGSSPGRRASASSGSLRAAWGYFCAKSTHESPLCN
ncbi:hypothetical protein BASA81_017968 [Batrachochytrium salamandrivorans]|nr:hypothetical protein BASA81_017968 [Batrachochytrium salamandrivorans]